MIGKNIAHDSGRGHVSGESIFVDDRVPLRNEVFVGILTAPIARGKLEQINIEQAQKHPDFLGFWSAKDVAHNKWGTIVHEQPLIVEDKISYRDEVVGIFAVSNRYSIPTVRKLFEIKTQAEPPVFSIKKARSLEKVLHRVPSHFIQGDVKKALSEADHVLKGEVSCGGQEHFYLESQAAIAYPNEHGQMVVHSSSQHPSETQRLVAEALGVPFHHVICVVKRMGGGFGGKESQAAPFAAYAAIAAKKLGRAARCVITKDEDMKITGKRHPFLNEYEIGFDNQGKILAYQTHLQADGGAYFDLTSSILERGMFHSDGAYFLKNCDISGTAYYTNNHSNTAFRGFGGPQGNLTIECLMEDIAQKLEMDALDVRRKNIYEGKDNLTPYNQIVENNMLPALFDQLEQTSNYRSRVSEIKKFNQLNIGKVRGISMSATKFGIAFTAKFLNQGNALVNVQLDGTVQVSTGATEMGQGVNTKIRQIVAHAFGLPIESVLVMETSTEKNHNTSPTAASSGSDINGAAALHACNKVKAKLCRLMKMSEAEGEIEVGKGEIDPAVVFKDGQVEYEQKKMSFAELCSKAYMNRISLSGYAHYKTPNLGFDINKVEGPAFNYFTQGCAVTEVELDEYTGELKLLRCDILMDLGRPLNPGVDRGQTSGAYIQGMGWLTSEALVYADDGELLSHSPTTYKIPNIHDTPREFNINFIENHDNERAVHRSKAVGEPPFLLGISAFTAIKNALRYRAKKDDLIQLTAPATNEIILNELERVKSGHGFK